MLLCLYSKIDWNELLLHVALLIRNFFIFSLVQCKSLFNSEILCTLTTTLRAVTIFDDAKANHIRVIIAFESSPLLLFFF